MNRVKLSWALLCLLALACPYGFADEGEPRNALGTDVYGATYNQYSISYERLFFKHFSAGLALGYSPLSLYNFYGSETDYTSYFLFQSDFKSYLLNDELKNLYVGFGVQMDLAPNPLNYKYGAVDYPSSSILATYGQAGWKFIVDKKSGFFIDPAIMFYTMTPLGITVNAAAAPKTWGYKLWAPMMMVTLGFIF
jgi:hypothetical protein